MNLAKHMDFFNPTTLDVTIHIIGLGAVGSHVAMMLTRLGCTKFRLYEFDIVVPHNVANQNFNADEVTLPKLDVTIKKMLAINPDIEIEAFEKGYTGQRLFGYVFLCLDNIDLRRQIVMENETNPHILAMMDFRMGLSDAQHYIAKWSEPKDYKAFLSSMQFTHEEAKAAQPVSACGTSMSIIPTVWMVTALGIANFINLFKGEPYKRMILLDSFQPDITAF